MPTENRSTMVVPRELLERIDRMYTDGMSIFGECEEVRALLAQPAQHQGEPVVLPEPIYHSELAFSDDRNRLVPGWNAYHDEIAKLGPLYTRPAPAETSEKRTLHIEVRECEGCNHIGIDDSHSSLAACHECDWSGPDPVEDKCPGCGRENVMAAACPDCGSRYALATSKTIEVVADPGEVEALKADKQAYAQNAIDLRGEVERLQASEDKWYQDSVNLTVERDALRAQLAEAQALLRDIASDDLPGNVHPHYRHRASAQLPASADPVSTAWRCEPCKIEMADRRPCDLCSAEPSAPASFQQQVQPWLMECFGAMIAGDRDERNHRFLEEALELVQSLGCRAAEAHQLVDYVYKRPIGEPSQEVGGVMVTLAALCLANGLDMHQLADTELARVWTKVEQIREKQKSKPQFGPLPGVYPGREQSAPVERDDQQDLRGHLNRMIGQAEYMLEMAENSADPEEDEDDGSFDECRKYIEQARAALERKP